MSGAAPIDRAESPGRRVASVLFVCGMNAIRSPMAEAIARTLLPKVYAVSAGVQKGDADPMVEAVLAEKAFTLGARQPQTLEDLADGYFDLIVTLAPEAHRAALAATNGQAVEVEHWQVPDPSLVEGSRAQRLDAYRDVRERIEKRIRERLAPA